MILEYEEEMNKRWESIDDEDPVNRLPFVASSIFTNQVDRYEPDDPVDRKLVIRWAEIIEEIIWVRGGPIEPIAGKDDDFFLAPRADEASARMQRLRERLEAKRKPASESAVFPAAGRAGLLNEIQSICSSLLDSTVSSCIEGCGGASANDAWFDVFGFQGGDEPDHT